MQPDELRNLLSAKQLNLLAIISDQLQKAPSQTDLNSEQLSQQAQMTENALQETIDRIGDEYGRRITSSTIRFNLQIIELNKQLQSNPVVDYHAKVQSAWKTNPWIGIPGGLLGIAALMIVGYSAFKPAIDAILKQLFP